MATVSTNHEEVGFGLERFDEAKNPFLTFEGLFGDQSRINLDYYEDNVDDDWYKEALGELAVKPYLIEYLSALSEQLSTKIELVDGTFLWVGHWTFDLSVNEDEIRALGNVPDDEDPTIWEVFLDVTYGGCENVDEQGRFDHYMDVFERQHDPEESCYMDEYNDFITTITKSLPDTVEEMDDYFSTTGWNWHERAVKENYRTNKELTDKLHDLYQQYGQEDAYTELVAYVYPSGLWHEEQAYFLREIIADYFTALDNQPAQLKLQL
jgi:hypothetical protein